MRELAAVFGMSKSQVHRVVADLGPRLAARFEASTLGDRRRTWIVDGTLVPTRDHDGAAKSKNYRWSCNVQVLVRHADRRIVAVAGGRQHRRVLADGGYRGIEELITPVFEPEGWYGPRLAATPQTAGPRRARDRSAQELARPTRSPATACQVLVTVKAVAYFHNLTIELRDNP